MARVPCLEHFERRAIAHFADNDAIGPKAQCHLHQVAHMYRGRRGLGQQLHRVRAGALQFSGVFQDDDARRLERRLRQKRVEQGRLTRTRAASDDDVALGGHRLGQALCLRARRNAVADVILEAIYDARAFADGEHRRFHQRRQERLHPRSGIGENRRQCWAILADRLAGFMRQQADSGFAVIGDQAMLREQEPSASAIEGSTMRLASSSRSPLLLLPSTGSQSSQIANTSNRKMATTNPGTAMKATDTKASRLSISEPRCVAA